MTGNPTDTDIAAWARLMRASTHVLGLIEADLKAEGFPPLSWYDVLLELRREPVKALRPADIERRILLAQYNVSRLIDRLEAAGYVEKRKSETDGRSVLVHLTASGEELLKRMWPAYSAALERHFARRFENGEAEELGRLLGRLLPH
jgi:DNA-binding MarR family transcriptional regulator